MSIRYPIASVLFLTAALIFNACAKERHNRNPENDCRLVKSTGILGRGGNYIDTAFYEYTNGLVSKISLSYGMQYEMFYDNNRLVKTEYLYSSTPGLKNVISLNYNTDGTLSGFNRYGITNGTDTVLISSNLFTYQNNLLFKAKYSEHNFTTNVLEHKADTYFVWDNGNISLLKTHKQEYPFDTTFSRYSYDTKQNYFMRLYGAISYPVVDPYFLFPSVGDFPFLLSRNNVIGFPDMPGFFITYPENSLGYPEAMYWDGDLNVRYHYSCQ